MTTNTSDVADLPEALTEYLEAQDALDNREYAGINAEPYEKLVRSRNHARAALESALAAGQAVVPAGPWSLGYADGNWRDIDHRDHAGVMRIVWRMEGEERTPKCEALAHAVIAALNGAAAPAQPVAEPANADSVLEDAARSERERICAAIKVEDDYCVEQGDYMLGSDDCIKIVRGEWVRPDFSADAASKQGATP